MAGFTLRFNISEVQKKSKEAQNSIHGVTESLKETNKFLKIVPREATNAERALSTSMQQAQNAVSGLNGSLVSLKKTALTALSAIGLEEFLRQSIKGYADYETALVNIGKVSDQSLASVDKNLRSIDSSLGSYTELATGYYQVLSAGVTDTAKSLDVLETSSKAAKASGVSQADTIKALTSLMTGYTGQLKGATDAADTLFAIERYGKTSVQELVPYIGELSSVSRIAGVNLNSLGASLSIITQTAGSTATASTQVKALFLETTKESENLKRVLSDLGKENFQELLQSSGGDILKALQTISKQAEKTGTSISSLFGSQEAQIAAKNLIDLASEYQKALTGLENRSGTLASSFGRYTKTINGLTSTTQSLLSNLATEIGESFGGVAAKALDLFNNGLTFTTENLHSLQAATASVVAGLIALRAVRQADTQSIRERSIALTQEIATAKQSAIQNKQLELQAAQQALSSYVSSKKGFGPNFSYAAPQLRQQMLATVEGYKEQIAGANAAIAQLQAKSGVLVSSTLAASKALSGLRSVGAGVLSFFGGPWGAAFTIAASAVAYLATRQSESEAIAERYKDVNTRVSQALKEQAKQAGDTETNIKNLSATQAKLAQEQAKRDQQNSLTALAFMANTNPWESYLNTNGEIGAVDKIRGVVSNFLQDVKNGKADIGATAKEISFLGSTSEDAAKFAQEVLNTLKNYDAASITIQNATNNIKNLTNSLNQASNASQVTKASLLSLSGIDEALKQSELIAFTNRLPTEMRSAASFLQSSFKDLKPEQIEKALKGTFEGFNPDDAKKLQQIINNLKTPKLKTSTKGTSEIDNAKEKVQQLREEIDRLNGTDVKANTDLSKTLREIESVGAKAKLSGDEINKLKTDYETAFKTSTLKEFNKELLQAQGNTKELRAIEIVEAINEWTTRLNGLGLTETEVTAKTNQLREAMNLQSQIKDAQAAADFYRELAELSGDAGRSQEYVDQLLSLQADNLIRNVGITRELADEWLRLQKIQNSREAWAGAYRATRQYFTDASNLASGFENLTTNAFSGIEDAIVSLTSTGKLSFSDMFNAIASDFIRMTTRMSITGPLANALSSGLASLFGGSGWISSSAAQAAASTSGYAGMGYRYSGGSAKGNVFSGGNLSDYRNSIVSGPTFFTHQALISKYAKGAGLMGEAGPEAVMPLVRTSGGNLGVRAEGTGNITPQINIQVINQTGTNATAEVQQQRNAQGGMDVVVLLKREMASDIARGGVLDQTIRGRYGVKPVVRGR